MLLLHLQTIMLCGGGGQFDLALRNILRRADTMRSVRAAVEAELSSLDTTFLPALESRIKQAPTEELLSVMEAMGEVLSRPELMRVTTADELITQHWRNLDDYWDLSEEEARAVDVDGMSEDGMSEISAQRSADGRGSSTYGEITRAGGRALFYAMGLSASARRHAQDAAVFVDLGSGAGRLVAQAWLELAPAAIIQRSVGVELAPSRHAAAQAAWASLSASGDAAVLTANAGAGGADPEFILGSLLEVNLTEATHVYVASLLMNDALLDLLWARFDAKQTPHLEMVASLRKFRAAGEDIVPEVVDVAMNWNGACPVYLYRF